MRLAGAQGDTSEMLRLARLIVDKPVKIPSFAVEQIKREAADSLAKYSNPQKQMSNF